MLWNKRHITVTRTFTYSDVVLIIGSNRLKVEVDELMLPKGFNTYFVEIYELPQSGKSMKKHTQKCCRVASERCKGLLHEHRAALCAGEKTAHRRQG